MKITGVLLRSVWLAAGLILARPGPGAAAHPPTMVDPVFNALLGPDNDVFALELTPSGQILAAGQFGQFNGRARGRLARLHADSQVDLAYFEGAGANDSIFAVAQQPDGRVLIGGSFTTVHGENQAYLARLTETGELDLTFAPAVNQELRAIAVEPTGHILIAGRFTRVNGQNRGRIARLNPDGTVDASFTPGLGANDNIRTLLRLADGRILIGGQFTNYNGQACSRLARLQPSGAFDAAFTPETGASGQVRTIATNHQAQVYIGGDFQFYDGVARPGVARLRPDGTLDRTFDPDIGAGGTVRAITVQADGKPWIGGQFFVVGRSHLTRLHPDGQADEFFLPFPGPDNEVFALRLDPAANRVLLAGDFEHIDEERRAHLAALQPDKAVFAYEILQSTEAAVESQGPARVEVFRSGSIALASTVEVHTRSGPAVAGVDFQAPPATLTFAPGETRRTITVPLLDDTEPEGAEWFHLDLFWPPPTAGTNAASVQVFIADNEFQAVLDDLFLPRFPTGTIRAFGRQPDGKIVIAGDFQYVGGCQGNSLARLNPNGEEDCDFFVHSTGADGPAYSVVVQPDGRILVGGQFTRFNSQPSPSLARVLPNGLTDPDFTPPHFNGPVFALARPADGKLLVGGAFTSVDGSSPSYLTRLLADGRQDPGFHVTLDGPVRALLIRTNGFIYVAGDFTHINGAGRSHVARLQPNGSLDPSFNPGPGPDRSVMGLAEQPDGRLLLGGEFLNVGRIARPLLARLDSQGSVDGSFNARLDAGRVNTVAVQPDGKIVFGGLFGTVAGTPQSHLSRVLPDGTLDTGFLPALGPNGPVHHVQIEPDARILVAGEFTQIIGDTRLRIARLFPEPSLSRVELVWETLGIPETQDAVEVKVRRAGPSQSQVTVDFETVLDSAQAGNDLIPQAGTLTFASGETLKTIRIPLINDGAPEGVETFRVRLSHPGGGALLGRPLETTVQIQDNDAGFAFEQNLLTMREGLLQATLIIRRNSDGPSPVTVEFHTVNGSAISGQDYQATNGTVTFLEGEDARHIDLALFVNPEFEGREMFQVVLSNPSAGTSLGAKAQATIQIEDQDSDFAFSIINNTEEGGEPVVPCYVFRHGPITETASIRVRSAGGTATPGADFAPIDRVLTFAPGEIIHEFYLTNYNDGLVEPTETVRLTLTEATGRSIISTPETNSLIFDNDRGVEFVRAEFYANEFAPSARVLVRRGDDGTNTLSVAYRTEIDPATGSATASVDYLPRAGQLSLPPGTTNATVLIPLLQDRLQETNEFFRLTLTSLSPDVVVGTQGVAQVVILDDEIAGSLDVGFEINPQDVSAFGFVSPWLGLVATPNGGLLASGWEGLVRLHPDGRRDTNFNAGPAPGYFEAVAAYRADGRILVGSGSTNGCCLVAAGNPCLRLLETNGAIHSDFRFPINAGRTAAILIPPDGTILVGGDFFPSFQPGTHRAVLRVSATGAIDPTFDAGVFTPEPLPDLRLVATVQSLRRTADGLILAAGRFMDVAGHRRTNLVRLTATGAVDPTFQGPALSDTNYIGLSPNGYVRAVEILPDGALLVAGSFTQAGTLPTAGLVRLLRDGAVDPTYQPEIESGTLVSAALLQPDGRLVVASTRFKLETWTYQTQLRRLYPDGRHDPTFDAGRPVEGIVTSLSLLPAGDIAIGGFFEKVNGIDRQFAARLRGDGLYLRTTREGTNGVLLELFNTWPDGISVIETSSDLKDWTRISTNAATGLSQRWPWPVTTSPTFFRAMFFRPAE